MITPEQQALVDAVGTGHYVVGDCGAGTGKSTTVVAACVAYPKKKKLVLTYNRAAAEDLKKKVPSHAKASTFHGFAYGRYVEKYGARLEAPQIKTKRIGELLELGSVDVLLTTGVRSFSPTFLATIVMRSLKKFVQSANREPSVRHLAPVSAPNPTDRATVNETLRPVLLAGLIAAWADIMNPDGGLPFNADCYLKMFQLDLVNERIRRQTYDTVFVDEAQDASLCRLSIAQNLGRQVVLVGDENQMINEWNGSINAMAHVSMKDAERVQLTQSFRFGPRVAQVANLCLNRLPTTLRVKGFDPLDTKIGEVETPAAILHRTNGGVMGAVVETLGAGRKPYVVGGVDDLVSFVKAATELENDLVTEHPCRRSFI